MGIFDIFTGAPAHEAADKQRAYLNSVSTTGREDIANAVKAGTGYIQGGTATGRADIGGGYTDASNFLTQAGGAFTPLADLGKKYGGATSLALGALGAGTPDQQAAARSAFTAGPGYQFNLDQGLEAINRRRNAAGMLASGNADRDAQEYGAGLASQEYNKWLDNLLGFTSPELTATGGAASGVSGVYGQQANLASDRGRMLADLASNEGRSLAGLETGAAGQKVGLASSLAGPYSQTYGDEAAAEMGGSGNLWNLALNVGKLATGQAGGAAGGGGTKGKSFVPVPWG